LLALRIAKATIDKSFAVSIPQFIKYRKSWHKRPGRLMGFECMEGVHLPSIYTKRGGRLIGHGRIIWHGRLCELLRYLTSKSI